MPTGSEWIAPSIAGLVLLISTVLGAVFARRGAKLGSREGRAPDVQEMWAQQEADRRMRQLVEDLWWRVRQAFQAYYRRVTALARRLDLPPDKLALFELTAKEQAAIDATLPED